MKTVTLHDAHPYPGSAGIISHPDMVLRVRCRAGQRRRSDDPNRSDTKQQGHFPATLRGVLPSFLARQADREKYPEAPRQATPWKKFCIVFLQVLQGSTFVGLVFQFFLEELEPRAILFKHLCPSLNPDRNIVRFVGFLPVPTVAVRASSCGARHIHRSHH